MENKELKEVILKLFEEKPMFLEVQLERLINNFQEYHFNSGKATQSDDDANDIEELNDDIDGLTTEIKELKRQIDMKTTIIFKIKSLVEDCND